MSLSKFRRDSFNDKVSDDLSDVNLHKMNPTLKTLINETLDKPQTAANPNISLLASLDDLSRTQNSLIQIDESVLTQLIKTCEKNRIEWLSTQRELEKYSKKKEKLEKRNKELNSNANHVRRYYGKEVQRCNDIKQQIKDLQQKKTSIKDFVKSQSTSDSSDESTVRLMDYLQRMDTTADTTHESLDGCEYDKSEEFN